MDAPKNRDAVLSGDAGPHAPTAPAGMTLRDWFAGQALVGILANQGPSLVTDVRARNAYTMADAMLAERSK